MSQVYSIDSKLFFNKEQLVIDRALDFVRNTRNRFNYGRDLDTKGLKDIDSVMRLFFTDGLEKDSFGEYRADFNASYGWETVMIDMFRHIAPVLDRGSYLRIFPDCDEVILEVVDNGIKVTRISTEEFEEE